MREVHEPQNPIFRLHWTGKSLDQVQKIRICCQGLHKLIVCLASQLGNNNVTAEMRVNIPQFGNCVGLTMYNMKV